MSPEQRAVIETIHDTSTMIVVVATGGGATAIAELLSVPGASRTVLEAVVPYAHSALTDWLDESSGSASASTALEMATAAHRRAHQLAAATAGEGSDRVPVAGVACTAALATDRDRRGEDRAHIAAVLDGATLAVEVAMERASGRAAQEAEVSAALIAMVARACGAAPG